MGISAKEQEKLEARRREIAEELGIPEDKIQVLPYKPPAGHEDPTPFRLEIEKEYLEYAEKRGVPVESLGNLYTRWVTYKNPFKEEQFWLTIRRNSST